MSKTINIKTEQFKQGLYNLINNANLPISNIYLVFKLLEKEIQTYYYQSLNEESQPEIITETSKNQVNNDMTDIQKKVEENA